MRLRNATLAAVTAHAVVLAALALAPTRRPVLGIEQAPASVDIALEANEADDAPASVLRANEPVAMRIVSRAASPARSGAAIAPRGEARVDTPPSAGATPGPDSAPWTFRPTSQAFDATARDLLGPNGVRGLSASTDATADRRSTTGGVAEALDEHDVALGISRGSAVLSAMEAVARAGTTPVRGSATFDVVVDASGAATVWLDDASIDRDAWAALVSAMRDAVTKRRVRVARGSNGERVVVRLESRVQYPDGRDPSADGAKLEARGFAAHETKTQITFQLPSVTAGVVGKTCAAGLHVGLDGVAILGGCSPENAGSVPQRIVYGRIVSDVRL